MLYREIIAVCSQIHTKHVNTLCGQNVELLNFKCVGTEHSSLNIEQISKYTYHILVTERVSESLFISAVTSSCSGKYTKQNPPFELSD